MSFSFVALRLYIQVQNNSRQTDFTGITEGRNLVSITYMKSNSNSLDDFMNGAVATLTAIPNTNDNNFLKKIGSDVSDNGNWKNGSFTKVYHKNSLEIILNINVGNNHSLLINTEEHIKKVRSK